MTRNDQGHLENLTCMEAVRLRTEWADVERLKKKAVTFVMMFMVGRLGSEVKLQ